MKLLEKVKNIDDTFEFVMAITMLLMAVGIFVLCIAASIALFSGEELDAVHSVRPR